MGGPTLYVGGGTDESSTSRIVLVGASGEICSITHPLDEDEIGIGVLCTKNRDWKLRLPADGP